MRLFQAIKKRLVGPKVFAVEMDSHDVSYMYLGVAYSLEEAMMQARKEILKNVRHAGIDIGSWHLKKYGYRELSELLDEATELTTFGADAQVDKNLLMRTIIDKKDVELFKENISIFSEPEKKMISAKLALGKPSKE